ncbi:uncharacterized protein LOC120335493 [Styela clava]
MFDYRNLPKVGFDVHIAIGNTGEIITLQGQKLTDKISAIHDEVFKTKAINPKNQRLFLAGEALEKEKTLSECNITKECALALKCFVPVLVSSLESPGPMLTEIEVSPKHDESIVHLKHKLGTKLGIDVDIQRLYLAPSEMTTFPRRRELDDISNLSRYLSPSGGNNFLELRPKIVSISSKADTIVFKVPMTVQNTRDNTHGYNLPNNELLKADLDVLPHEHYLKEELYWLSLELSTVTIIKRDPIVDDIVKILQENLRPIGRCQNHDLTSPVRLKFARNRLINGGKYLVPDRKCGEDYQMRTAEQLLNVEIDGHEPPESTEIPAIYLPAPLPPLVSYGEKHTRYSVPKHHICMKWEIPSKALQKEVNPSVEMEISAFSYSRLCGSWDIAEHYKTYVEILLEGTFYTNRNSDSHNDPNNITRANDTVFSQNCMDITILGPENDNISSFKIINKDPMRWYRKSAEGSEKYENKSKTLGRELGFSSPFRYDTRPVNMPKPIDVRSDVICYGKGGFSELVVNNWYIGKERVSDITLQSSKNKTSIFNASCKRGVNLSENPFVKFSYKNMYPSLIDREENRRAYDFRVQAQFFVCELEEDFEKKSNLTDSKRFTIFVNHGVTKTEREPNFSDTVTEFTSPDSGQMETTISVDLANNLWLNKTGHA